MKKFIFPLLMLPLIIVFIYFSKEKPSITYDTSSPNAVVESYFLALNNKDSKFITSTITDGDSHVRTKTSDIKSVDLIELQQVSGSNEEILFKVKYRIQLKNGSDLFGENGINSKFLTLVKDKESNKWILRSIGEG